MGKSTYLIVVVLLLSLPLAAQSESEDEPWSVNESTLIGAGGYKLMDTYLSPGQELNYVGWGVRILNERIKMIRLGGYKFSRQQILNVDVTTTDNPAKTATDLAAFADYGLAYHYQLRLAPAFKMLAGLQAHAMGGFIYNTRNGNNPVSAKADIDIAFSLLGIYSFRFKNYPLALRYQAEIPFAGVLFSPHLNQSYYEIFNLGNTDGIIQFNSFHNKFAMKNYLTLDFPVGSFSLRAGYLNSLYYTDVNGIKSHIISHSFLIGVVKEFVTFGGRRLKNTSHYRSAFY